MSIRALAHRMSVPPRRAAVYDFLLLEMLILARLPVGLPRFRRLVMWAAAVAAFVVFAAGALLALVILARTDDAHRTATLGAVSLCLVATMLVSCGAYIGGGVWGARRLAVRLAPQRALLRAVDAPMVPVYVMAVIVRSMPLFAGWLCFALGWAVTSVRWVTIDVVVLVVVAPVALATLNAGTGAWLAARPVGRSTRAAGVAVVAAAVGAGWLAAAPLTAVSGAGVSPAELSRTGTFILLGVTALGVWGAAAGRARIRVLRADPFPLVVDDRAGPARRSRRLSQVLHRHAHEHLWRRSSMRVIVATTAVLGAVAGLRLGGFALPPLLDDLLGASAAAPRGIASAWIPADTATLLRQSAVALTATLAFLILESSLPQVGPGRTMPHLRFAWEAGRALPAIVTAAVSVVLTRVGLVALAMSTILVLLTAEVTVAVLAAAVSVVAAALIADTALRRVRFADGSTGQSMVAALVMMACAAPAVLAGTLADGAMAMWASALGGVALMGGAVWCVAHRVRRHWS